MSGDRALVMLCDVDLDVADATRIHTVEVAKELAAAGHRVFLLTRGGDPGVPGVVHRAALGTDHQRLRRILTMNAQAILLILRHRTGGRRLYLRHRWTLLAPMALARLLGYRIVTQMDGLGFEPPVSPRAERIHVGVGRAMGVLTHGVVAVTPQIKDALVRLFGVAEAKIVVLPNGVDVREFVPIRREQALQRVGLDSSHRHVLFCGHFAPWVDFPTILESFAIVSAQHADARLVLLGDGSERPAVEALIDRHGLDGRVLITGFVRDRQRVRDYIAASVVTVSANRPERRASTGVSPVKIAEYMACGRAVVMTDVPGVGDLLRPTGAVRVVAIDSVAVAQALSALLDPEAADAVGRRGREVAEQEFSWREIVRRTLELY